MRAMAEEDLGWCGTSRAVYPTAALRGYRRSGSRLAMVNRDPTPLDREADVVIHDKLCEITSRIAF